MKTKKIKLELLEEIELQIGWGDYCEKYKTQIDNVYVYHVQLGHGLHHSIIKDQKDDRSTIYGEMSVIVTYSHYVDCELCGEIVYTVYTYGLKSKYYVE